MVAARNEQNNIDGCLAALVALDYPKDRLEIIVVDDSSTDRTPAIVRRYADTHPFCPVIHAVEMSGPPHEKVNAIAQGIDAARGEILLFTDADCTVPPLWAREIASHYQDKVGLVAGYPIVEGTGWFSALQTLDWLFLVSVEAAGMALKKPYTVVGNNLSVRKSIYDELGGYRNIKFSVTEDFALFNAIRTRTSYEMRFLLNQGSSVRTKPCETFRDLYRQRKRWAIGALDIEWKDYVTFAGGFALDLLLVLALFFGHHFIVVLFSFAAKLCIDFLFLLKPMRTFRLWKLLPYFLHFELYTIFNTLTLPFIALTARRIDWKGQTLSLKQKRPAS